MYGLNRRKAPVVVGRPSACHGFAVACIGQPPPPSALGPVWWVVAGWAALPRLRWLGGLLLGVARVLARVSSRGCAAGDGLLAHSLGFFCIEAPSVWSCRCLLRVTALQPVCLPFSALVLVE